MKKNELNYKLLMWLIIMVFMIVAVLFCVKKQGFHFDENYSYYSTNTTYGLWPSDNEWKDVNEIKSEYQVLTGETLNLGLVKISQSYDVHPPLYYYLFRIVCFFSKDIVSKWQGLIINLVFYFGCLILLWKIADIAGKKNKYINFFTLAIFGLSPGFVSIVIFIRMYTMLTFLCFAVLYIAMKSFADNEWNWKKCFIPTFIVSCFGFLTHYYFIVFAFFVAAYTCLYLFFHKETRIKACIYGGSVSAGILAAIAYYPVCLSHIFSGYRGTEATEAFVDMSNTFDRIEFFTGLLNDYTFSGTLYVLILVIALLYIFHMYKKTLETRNNLSSDKEKNVSEKVKRPEVVLLIIVAVGFFLMVCKTGMKPSNPAEALRYPCPSYGLIILIVVMGIILLFERISTKIIVPCICLVIVVACQIVGLFNEKVFFVYPEAEECYEWARDHKDADIVYIYNPGNTWMIWNDALELMEYDQIYFIARDNSDEIEDAIINNSKSVIVYTCRSDESEVLMQRIIDSNDNVNSAELISERLYIDIYELK